MKKEDFYELKFNDYLTEFFDNAPIDSVFEGSLNFFTSDENLEVKKFTVYQSVIQLSTDNKEIGLLTNEPLYKVRVLLGKRLPSEISDNGFNIEFLINREKNSIQINLLSLKFIEKSILKEQSKLSEMIRKGSTRTLYLSFFKVDRSLSDEEKISFIEDKIYSSFKRDSSSVKYKKIIKDPNVEDSLLLEETISQYRRNLNLLFYKFTSTEKFDIFLVHLFLDDTEYTKINFIDLFKEFIYSLENSY